MHAQVNAGQWEAQLTLGFARRGQESFLATRSHRGPLRVQRPFYPEGPEVCLVLLLHPPGGLVSGDTLDIRISVAAQAWAQLTTPGAGKYYRSDGVRSVQQHQHLRIADGGVLEWLPQEGILFDGARADLLTRVELEGTAQFLGWEITCLGRPASGERLQLCDLRQRFELWRDGSPVWLERSAYGDHSPVFSAAWGLRNHTVCATLVCTGGDAGVVERIRAAVTVAANECFAVTLLDEVIVCRYLGDHGERARRHLISAWRVLRREVLRREALPPRIWNT